MIEILTTQRAWTEVKRQEVRRWLKEAVWIYHYDLIKTPSDRIEILDLAIPAFLGAPPRFRKLLSALDGRDSHPEMISKLDSMTEALRLIPQHVDLWDWPLDEGNNRANLRDLISECRVPSYAVASIFKMLHLKRPQLIPVIDDWTRQAWNGSNSRKWTFDELVEIMSRMSRELGARREGLEELQTVAQDLGWPFNSLSRLRLYDVAFYGHEIETSRQRIA